MQRVQVGMQRFGGQEDQRALGGLPGADVFAGDVIDMPADIDGQPALGRGTGGLIRGAAQRLPGFQREFAVDGDGAGRKGQADQRVAAQPIGQGVLPGPAFRR